MLETKPALKNITICFLKQIPTFQDLRKLYSVLFCLLIVICQPTNVVHTYYSSSLVFHVLYPLLNSLWCFHIFVEEIFSVLLVDLYYILCKV